MSEIVNPLPEVSHQVSSEILEPSAVGEINLLCQWCNRARRLNEFVEVRKFGLEAFCYSAI